jgi:hypothetical protein
VSAYVASRLTAVAVSRTGPGRTSGHGPTAGDTVVRGEVVED